MKQELTNVIWQSYKLFGPKFSPDTPLMHYFRDSSSSQNIPSMAIVCNELSLTVPGTVSYMNAEAGAELCQAQLKLICIQIRLEKTVKIQFSGV